MRIDELMVILQAILEDDPTLKDSHPTLTITHKFLDTAVDAAFDDYPYISLRYVNEVAEEQIGHLVETDVDGNLIEGMLKTGTVTAFCWDETVNGCTKLADLARKALFKKRGRYEADGLLDICNMDVSESTPARAPFDGYRSVVRVTVWLKEEIDILE